MKRVLGPVFATLALVGCDEIALPMGGGGVSAPSGGGGFREYLVLGSTMSFEQCRSRGGMIIRDAGSPMVACDPRVVRQPVPADEFNHPGSPVPQTAATPEASET